MKKLVSIIMAALLAFSLCACVENNISEDGLSIVAVSFPEYDFSRAVTGDSAEITMLIPPGGETHGYEPTVSDIKAVSKCDLFIYTGGESDSWVKGLLDSVNNPNLVTLAMIDFVTPICAEDDHDHNHEADSKFTADEHVWTSPVNAVSIVNGIKDSLCKIDSNQKETFTANAKAYIDKLNELDKSIREVTDNAKSDTLVFGDRFPLIYFTEEYGLEYMSAFHGCSEDTEASASTVAQLIDYVKDKNVSAVFVNELSNTAIAQQIAEETGAEVLTFYSCHKVSKDDFESGKTYVDIMSRNIENLETALN